MNLSWLQPIGGILSILRDTVAGWQERKRIKVETATAVERLNAEHTVAAAERGELHTQNWENKSRDYVPWADDLITALSLYPVVASFWGVPVDTGFKTLTAMPDWYLGLLSIVVGSAFGYRVVGKWTGIKRKT